MSLTKYNYLQYVQTTSTSVYMAELMTSILHVYLIINVVIMLLTVLEETMNWITTVPVDRREQFV